MHPMQRLYSSPVYPDGLRWSKEGLLAAGVGSVVTIADPYRLKERLCFAQSTGFDPESVSRTEASPKDPQTSIAYALETLWEFAMRDTSWKAQIKGVAWSPRNATAHGLGSLLAVVQSDRRVLIYCLPKRTSTDWLQLVANLTSSIAQIVEQTSEWKDPGGKNPKSSSGLRLRGGGRTRGRGRGRGRGRSRSRSRPSSSNYVRKFTPVEATESSTQIVSQYQFPKEMDASIAASIEAEDDNQFRLDLPKVVLSLWMEIRSNIPEEELPKYRKGEYLTGIDQVILDKVMDYMVCH